MIDRLDTLPGPQRDAVATAFGLALGASPDRLLVGLATLSLLSAASDEGPLLCVVDDVQWLDRESRLALTFVARRLLADPIGLVFATREPYADLAEFPELVLAGLGDTDARKLLDTVLRVSIDERVRDRLVAETHGNPLALVEWPRGMTPTDMAGGFGMPSSMAMTGQIEESFRRRLAELPESASRFVTVAAAEPTGDPALVWRAASALGIDASDASRAIELGFLDVGTRVVFRHPLVRSAAYRSAAEVDRRRAHGALADATESDADPDRRAWHRAHAADGPDESVALELEQAAARAQARGGLAAAASFLERSVVLTADSTRRFERTLAAAAAKFYAGDVAAGQRLLVLADALAADTLERVRVTMLRGGMSFLVGTNGEAPSYLVEAAREIESVDPRLAAHVYIHAFSAASAAGSLSQAMDLPAVARAARSRVRPSTPSETDLLLDGLALFDTDGPRAAAPVLGEAVAAYRSPDLPAEAAYWLTLSVATASTLWDHDSWNALASLDLQRARDAGALTTMSFALNHLACVRLFAGDLDGAGALLDEAQSIVEATRSPYVAYGMMYLEALRGREAQALGLIEAGIETSIVAGQGLTFPYARSSAATLYNGLARYDEALAAAQQATTYPRHWGSHLTLHELVEAAVRTGTPEVAADALEWISATALAAGNDWGLGIRARTLALLSDGSDADALYREAIERLARTELRTELARAHLLYGEWLRRQNRRVDAREHLRVAHEMLSSMGMDAFAERARRELLATGERVRKRSVETFDELTPQEAHIARLAADGCTNPEIGAQLFISPRTVEWHLRKVFSKVGVTSRRELSEALARQERRP